MKSWNLLLREAPVDFVIGDRLARPVEAVSCGSKLVLRLDEMVSLRLGSLSVEAHLGLLLVQLPESKTDPTGIGAVIGWRCICRPGFDRQFTMTSVMRCPKCCIIAYVEAVHGIFLADGCPEAAKGIHVFVSCDLQPVTAQVVIRV